MCSIIHNVYCFNRKYATFAGSSIVVLIFLSAFLMQASRNGNDLWLTFWVDTSTGTNSTRFYLVRVLSIFVKYEAEHQYIEHLQWNCTHLKLTCADYPCHVWYNQFAVHVGKGIFFCIRWPPCSNPYPCISSRKYHQCTSLFLWPKSEWSDSKQVRMLSDCQYFLVKPRKVEMLLGLDDALWHLRLSSDLYAVDDSLPFILNIFVANFFSLLGTLVILSYSQVNYEQLF